VSFSAVILAGGKSSRMGQDKAFMEIGGETLLARQIRLAREAGVDEVLISGRTNVDYSSFGCRVLRDRLQDTGPLGGIERGLATASSPLLSVLAVDMPRMTREFLERLFAQCKDGVGIIPRVNGEIEPLAAVYPKAALELVEKLLSVPGQAARASAFAKDCVSCGLARFVDLTESEAHFFGNWNSPHDLK
jgi:molybdopterin-guanine dinucleotide biosynthesis protein A